uniref:hypothetical protein n=2 Tax=Enterobacteriaceae TaxID=543 RepID=UPI00155DAB41|nr:MULTISPECIES: hypothetical protein [Enterobacteriaceae]
MIGSTASAKALASAKSAGVPKALQNALAEAVDLLHIFDFKRFFNLRKIVLIFIVLFLHYFLSDGSLISFIKQLIGWLIVPFLTNILNKKD